MLYEMNEKGFSGSREYFSRKGKENKDFEEFLGVINLFSDSERKPIKTPLINSRSLAELLGQSVNYTKFNTEFFEGKKLSSHDSNNLILLRAVVEHNHEILLRMFNEVPLYMSVKLNLHHNSQRYFLLKLLLLCAGLANPYKQMNQSILEFLQDELEFSENAEIIKNIMGVDKDLFTCFCASESGDFTLYLQYLAKKNEKYYGLISLFCWFQLPFLSKIYELDADPDQNADVKSRQGLSVLLMYGLFECTNEFFLANKKDMMKDEIGKLTLDYLRENLQEIMKTLMDQIRSSAPLNPSWFALELKDIWNKINEDFMSEIFQNEDNSNDNMQNDGEGDENDQDEENKEEGSQDEEKSQEKEESIKEKEESIKEKEDESKKRETVINNLREVYVKDYMKAIELFTKFIDDYFIKNSEDSEKNPLFKFFPSLFYATSGLARYELMDGLLTESQDPDILEKFFFACNFKKGTEPDKTLLELVKNYRGIIQIIMIGFEKLEKNKKDRLFDPTEHLKDILESM